jgi:hypothetical protein
MQGGFLSLLIMCWTIILHLSLRWNGWRDNPDLSSKKRRYLHDVRAAAVVATSRHPGIGYPSETLYTEANGNNFLTDFRMFITTEKYTSVYETLEDWYSSTIHKFLSSKHHLLHSGSSLLEVWPPKVA